MHINTQHPPPVDRAFISFITKTTRRTGYRMGYETKPQRQRLDNQENLPTKKL